MCLYEYYGNGLCLGFGEFEQLGGPVCPHLVGKPSGGCSEGFIRGLPPLGLTFEILKVRT